MEFLLEYGLFLAKALTLVVAILFVVSAAAAVGQRSRSEGLGHIEITPLHERIEDWADALNDEMLDEDELKSLRKEKKRLAKQEKKQPPAPKKRLFVLDFDGDIKASEVDNLREEITAILSIAKESDEILLRLESPGGMVHSYGLAASQLQRIRSKNLKLTIAVDRVAASGGYMMACIGDRILAAPFAVIGSVGVVAQLPNFHRLLKKHDVDVELHTAGEHKRTLTMIGENTEEGRKKFVEELQDTHDLFKEFVTENREQLDVNDIATGEVWYGRRALDKQLIDDIQTSDDYILAQRESANIFQISYKLKKSLPEKFGFAAKSAFTDTIMNVLEKLSVNRHLS